MNYKKIAKHIKDARRLVIWNNGREQFIGDGAAFFPINGMPYMNETEMLVFLGLNEQIGKIAVEKKEAPEWFKNIEYDTDAVIEHTGPSFILHGELHKAYYSDQGAIIVNSKYIGVAINPKEIDLMSIQYIGKRSARSIVVFYGFDLQALICPIKSDTLADMFAVLSDQIRIAEKTQEDYETDIKEIFEPESEE